jgi:quercetin dioxygenase-like cupin family protein
MTEPRKGLKIFRYADAPELQETDMMSMPVFNDDFVRPTVGRTADVIAGQHIRVLYRQSEEEGGFSLVYAYFKPHFVLPRHSHSADCLYYVIAGSAVMGNQVLQAGDGFFVPSGAPYQYSAGPEGVQVLEFRHARAFDMRITDNTERYAAMLEAAAEHAPGWASILPPLSTAAT